ncbi:MAG: hypothetical protein ACLQE9_21775 [Roseiarcus sp.]
MSIPSLPSIVGSCAAPFLSNLQQASASPSASPSAGSSGAPTFAGILAGLGNAANPLNFISTPAAAPPGNSQPTGILGELSSLLSSI